MSNTLKLIATTIAIFLAVSCKKEPPSPGKPVTFDTFCAAEYNPKMVQGLNVGPRVSLEGYMGLSGMFTLQSSTLLITLFSEPDRKGSSANISLKVGSDENEIAKLGKKYTFDDLKVKTQAGSVAGPGDKVRVHGMRMGEDKDKSCYMKVDLVEKL
jgi:hypothetical protein